jgi:hypothetical protein
MGELFFSTIRNETFVTHSKDREIVGESNPKQLFVCHQTYLFSAYVGVAPTFSPAVVAHSFYVFRIYFLNEIGLLKFAVKEHSHLNRIIPDEKKKIWGSKIKNKSLEGVR